MTLPEQMAKALPVGVQKALEQLITAAQEANQALVDAQGREKALPQSTAECVWVTSAGKEVFIGDMHPHHAKNALAKIANMLDRGMVAYKGKDGKVTFADRLQHVKDDKDVFIDDGGNINEF